MRHLSHGIKNLNFMINRKCIHLIKIYKLATVQMICYAQCLCVNSLSFHILAVKTMNTHSKKNSLEIMKTNELTTCTTSELV